jgi:hypothetical protein
VGTGEGGWQSGRIVNITTHIHPKAEINEWNHTSALPYAFMICVERFYLSQATVERCVRVFLAYQVLENNLYANSLSYTNSELRNFKKSFKM